VEILESNFIEKVSTRFRSYNNDNTVLIVRIWRIASLKEKPHRNIYVFLETSSLMTRQEMITETVLFFLFETNSLNCDPKKYKETRMEKLYFDSRA